MTALNSNSYTSTTNGAGSVPHQRFIFGFMGLFKSITQRMKDNYTNTKPLIYDLIAINKITHKYPLHIE